MVKKFLIALCLYTILVHPARAASESNASRQVNALFEEAKQNYSPVELQRVIALAKGATDADGKKITLLLAKALYYKALSYYLNGEIAESLTAINASIDTFNVATDLMPTSLEAIGYRVAARALLRQMGEVSATAAAVEHSDAKTLEKVSESNEFALYASAMTLFYETLENPEKIKKAAHQFRTLAKNAPQNTEYRAFALYFLALTDADKKAAAVASLSQMINNNQNDRLALFLKEKLGVKQSPHFIP
jgi:hypothetical protein